MDNRQAVVETLYQELPVAIATLQNSQHTLQQISDYCEGEYRNATTMGVVLETTMKYLTDSAGAVAENVLSICTKMSTVLELQTEELEEMAKDVRSNLAVSVTVREFCVNLTARMCVDLFAETENRRVQIQQQPSRPTSVRTSREKIQGAGHG